jgi:hypothetical protein
MTHRVDKQLIEAIEEDTRFYIVFLTSEFGPDEAS